MDVDHWKRQLSVCSEDQVEYYEGNQAEEWPVFNLQVAYSRRYWPTKRQQGWKSKVALEESATGGTPTLISHAGAAREQFGIECFRSDFVRLSLKSLEQFDTLSLESRIDGTSSGATTLVWMEGEGKWSNGMDLGRFGLQPGTWCVTHIPLSAIMNRGFDGSLIDWLWFEHAPNTTLRIRRVALTRRTPAKFDRTRIVELPRPHLDGQTVFAKSMQQGCTNE